MSRQPKTGTKRRARLLISFVAMLAGSAHAEEPKADAIVTPPVPVIEAPVAADPAIDAADPKTRPAPISPAPKKTGTAPTSSAATPAAKSDAAASPAAAKTVEPAEVPAEASRAAVEAPTDADKVPPAKGSAAKAAEPAKADAKPATPAATLAPAKAPAEAKKPVAAAPAEPAKPSAASEPPASSPEAETVWRAYEKRWSETEDYSAGFRQVIEVPDVGSKVESAGRFYFAKPGLVRWDYVEGPPQTVVGDGTWIWLYQPDLEQVYKIPYAKAFGRGGLVELLAGREGVSERYSTSIERPDPATVRILLKSLTEGGGNLEVTLEADTFDLRAVTVHDAAGSITSMTFAEPRRNNGADRERFTFTPPPAVDIISDNEAGF